MFVCFVTYLYTDAVALPPEDVGSLTELADVAQEYCCDSLLRRIECPWLRHPSSSSSLHHHHSTTILSHTHSPDLLCKCINPASMLDLLAAAQHYNFVHLLDLCHFELAMRWHIVYARREV